MQTQQALLNLLEDFHRRLALVMAEQNKSKYIFMSVYCSDEVKMY